MKEYDLQKLINNTAIVDEKIKELMDKKLLFKQDVDKEEVKGHVLKAEHNLRFIAAIAREKFFDWALTGCYYACYHAAFLLKYLTHECPVSSAVKNPYSFSNSVRLSEFYAQNP